MHAYTHKMIISIIIIFTIIKSRVKLTITTRLMIVMPTKVSIVIKLVMIMPLSCPPSPVVDVVCAIQLGLWPTELSVLQFEKHTRSHRFYAASCAFS